MVEAVELLVPEGEAVASDFMNSTAILAHTSRPILLQPAIEVDSGRPLDAAGDVGKGVLYMAPVVLFLHDQPLISLQLEDHRS